MNIQKISPWFAILMVAVLAAACAPAQQAVEGVATQAGEMIPEMATQAGEMIPQMETQAGEISDQMGEMMDEASEAMQGDSSVETPDWYGWELTDVNSGNTFRVSDEQGKVILVETMAVWCPNCLKQQQEVKQLLATLGPRDDFVSLAIDIDPNEDVDMVTQYTQKNGFDWRYVVASDELINAISSEYGAQYLNPPSTPMLIIDKQGGAHTLPFGIKSAADLQAALAMYLNEE